jgi:anaphase-promoting complex subunit 8
MQDAEQNLPASAPPVPSVLSINVDPQEAQMESREASKYLLAKSYFDCREYDRCAAVFLPLNVSREPLSENASPNVTTRTPTKVAKGKAKETASTPVAGPIRPQNTLPRLSQKSLFLALYARYLSGEKRRDEDSEMILGPADGGTTVNKELVGLGRSLEGWFADQEDTGNDSNNQGWLEYLYGIILVKSKSEEDGKKWLIKSVHLWPFNWGAWLELSELLTTVEDVSFKLTTHLKPATDKLRQLHRVLPLLPQNIMTSIFYVYASQELYQSTEPVYQQLTELERIFPQNLFLTTQRALLFYHSKGLTAHNVVQLFLFNKIARFRRSRINLLIYPTHRPASN